MTMLRILGRPTSINVRKVLWTCDELGLAYTHEADWATPDRPTQTDAYRALNPNALVPVIVDEDFVLWESNTICRYLAGRDGPSPLLPTAPRERARVEQWMDWQATELNTAWRHAFLGLVRRSPAFQDPAAIAHSAAEWNRHMQMLDQRLASTGAWVAGEAFTLADILLALGTHRWRSTPIERPVLPAVDAWWQRLVDRPGFARHCSAATP
jgi:glutathione S-transferase